MLYAGQLRLQREGANLTKTIAVDYSERLAGTSLGFAVKTASEVYESGGDLVYGIKGARRKIGCILHAQGQKESFIDRDIQMQIRQAFKARFTPEGKHAIKIFRSVAV